MELPADGVSGATRVAGKHVLRFDATQANLAKLPAGDYNVAVEVAREQGGRELVRAPLHWQGLSAQAGTSAHTGPGTGQRGTRRAGGTGAAVNEHGQAVALSNQNSGWPWMRNRAAIIYFYFSNEDVMNLSTVMKRPYLGLLGTVLVLLSAGAQAHMPYMLPNYFDISTRNYL
ncbi:MAG: DUF2271 domain-containing protein [Rhodoferax sp.]|nr:DUF2271 domain-containing protein [Rhodoferax sp.]MDZ7922073.1 DUF2271 domain-containing protein [Rhodoferax sp.]